MDYRFEQRVLEELANIREILLSVQSDLNADDAALKQVAAQLGTIVTNLTAWFANNPTIDTSAVDSDVAALTSVSAQLATIAAPAAPATPPATPPATS